MIMMTPCFAVSSRTPSRNPGLATGNWPQWPPVGSIITAATSSSLSSSSRRASTSGSRTTTVDIVSSGMPTCVLMPDSMET